MNVLNKIDWNVLRSYIDNNLIIANKHPEYDIWILNYSPRVQSKDFWDDYTLSCRGLVIDDQGNIIARPFRKFKNIEEHQPHEINMLQEFDVFEKMDGSLIIVFYYQPRMKWIVASRGSFISEQSVEAQKILKAHDYDIMDEDNTYLFEVIYPENRIVVDYGDKRDLVMLAVIDTKTGHEMPYDVVNEIYSKHFTIVRKYEVKGINNLKQLREREEDNKEGFVVKFADGMRVKVKFDEYVRLHSILTNVSNLTVWEHLMNNYDFDILLDRVPDEFYNWLKRTAKLIQGDFNDIEREALKEFIRITHINEIGVNGDRKSFAIEACKTQYRSILFKLYDKKPYDELIWKMVRPVYSKPFRDGYDYSV